MILIGIIGILVWIRIGIILGLVIWILIGGIVIVILISRNETSTQVRLESAQPSGSRVISSGPFTSELVTVDRKEFEGFLSDHQALVESSQKLVERIDVLEKVNKQLRDDLKTTKEKFSILWFLDATMNTSKSQTDESLRKARETTARLVKESEKWASNQMI